MQRVKETEFLGKEFLLWLWSRSENNAGLFALSDGRKAELWFDGKMTLSSESDRGTDTITCSGPSPWMEEARFALTEGKMITKAALKLYVGENQWSFVLDSEWLNFRSLKTIGVVQDKAKDPDGLFYEKVFLTEQAVEVMDAIFEAFINLRLSPKWGEEEVPRIQKWMKEGKKAQGDT
jgi:recombination associated protein RdgC